MKRYALAILAGLAVAGLAVALPQQPMQTMGASGSSSSGGATYDGGSTPNIAASLVDSGTVVGVHGRFTNLDAGHVVAGHLHAADASVLNLDVRGDAGFQGLTYFGGASNVAKNGFVGLLGNGLQSYSDGTPNFAAHFGMLVPGSAAGQNTILSTYHATRPSGPAWMEVARWTINGDFGTVADAGVANNLGVLGATHLAGATTLGGQADGGNLSLSGNVTSGGVVRGAQFASNLTDTTGTPGDATCNTTRCRFAFANAGANNVTITNSLVTATSHIECVIQEVDTLLNTIRWVVPTSGSFTVYANSAAGSGNPDVSCLIVN